MSASLASILGNNVRFGADETAFNVKEEKSTQNITTEAKDSNWFKKVPIDVS